MKKILIQKKTFRKWKNHLWIKVYTIVFIAVLLMLLLIVKIWQVGNMSYLFNKERVSAIEHHYYVADVLYNAVFASNLNGGIDEILAYEIKTQTKSAFYYNLGELAVFYNDTFIAGTYQEVDDMDRQLVAKRFFDEDCHLENYKKGKSYYIKAISCFHLIDKDYFLITTKNISDIYRYQSSFLRRVLTVCIIGGIIVAFILLSVFKISFRALKDINENVRMIAAGSYDKRIVIKRRDELGELACNVNEMAQAVGDNVRSLQKLAGEQKRFIDNLTHEMKTPLTSIISFADIIQIDGNITREKTASHAKVIAHEGRRLNIISQKLMDFIHIEKINEEDKIAISIKRLFDDINSSMEPIFGKKNIRLKQEVQDYTICVDYELFKTMLCNYLDNAIKASDENSVIEIKSYMQNKDGIIKIIDYGVGISEEEIEKIEEPFYMVDKSRSRKEGGAGLGMALCRKIVSAHDGQVYIVSKLNKGTEIKLVFSQLSEQSDF